MTTSAAAKHYVRRWANEGILPKIRVTRSVDHAIYLTFGTTLEHHHMLRFVVCTDLGYQTLVATTLYVPILCAALCLAQPPAGPSASTISCISRTRT
jgi:hypothetical protein